MILKKLEVFIIYAIFIVVSTVVFVSRIDLINNIQSTKFFLNDTQAYSRLNEAIQSDYDTDTIFVTRLLHNKPLIYLETFFISILRSIDLSFLFSLSRMSSMYEDSFDIKMLHPVEFIFFLFSLTYFIKKIDSLKKYFYIILALLLSFLIIGLFLPTIHYVKLIPLVVTLRTIYFIGIFQFLKDKQWLRISQ